MKTKTFITVLLSMLFVTTLFLGACDKEETKDGDLDYMTDTRDGQTYAIVKIGSQTWMVDNLNYNTNESWWYNNSSEKGDVYGRLYSWEAAMEACPSGWHLPGDEEWKELEMALGMNPAQADDIGWRGNNQGDQMKSTLLWNNDGNGTNTSNFTGYPGGLRSSITEGEFQNMGDLGNWWTSTESVGDYVVYRYLHYDSPGVGRHNNSKTVCLSVRCVKD